MTEAKLLAELRRICLGLPEVHETVKWGHPTFEAGKKMFAVLDKYDGKPCIAFRVTPEKREALLADGQFFDAPYAAKHGWVCCYAENLSDLEGFSDLLQDSYRMVALKRMLIELAGSALPVGSARIDLKPRTARRVNNRSLK
jgi:predicted DNA-binding protein (MmcQ/YjbR family)